MCGCACACLGVHGPCFPCLRSSARSMSRPAVVVPRPRGGCTLPAVRVLTVHVRFLLCPAGPMAHPIRPESYIKMDNFYTLTVYEKGALLPSLALFGAAATRRLRWFTHACR